MRKVILQVQISIDGYMADKKGNTDWMVWNWESEWNWDDELRAYHNALTASVDCILLSRKMAEDGFIDHWATMAENQDNPQSEFAKQVKEAHKVVFTKTLNTSAWENTVLAKGDFTEEINTLKKTTGRNIIAYGGVTFASSLLQAGLVDELHLIINPSVLGNGLSLFSERRSPLHLSLLHSTSYTGGIVVVTYTSKR